MDGIAGNGFMTALQARVADVLEACTRCGKCVEVCPMPDAVGIDRGNAESIAGGVLDILRDGSGPEQSVRWAEACTGSGYCIGACEYGVNPRFMLAMARTATRRHKGETAVRDGGAAAFRHMSKGVRVLSRLQLPLDRIARLGPAYDAADAAATPDIIFYTGCNVLKTPHIVLLALDILDALGIRYKVMGGPTHCCGVLQFNAGDPEISGRVALGTIDRFVATGATDVITWCPSCQKQYGDVVLPSYQRATGASPFDMTMFIVYIAGRLDALKPFLVNRVEKRVGLHEHPGIPGVSEAARAILEAIPGLEFVDLEQPRMGGQCSDFIRVPEIKRDAHAEALEAAERAGVTTLAGVYHACHRDMCSHERDWPFEVVNFLELVGDSMGVSHPDLFKRLKIMQDVDAIIADSQDMIESHGLKPAEVREIVLADMLGDQTLPLRGDAETGH